MASDLEVRIRHTTAVLGPTNTGKTHLAIERMLGHESGMIGLPLRLLAREVYDKIAARIGADSVGLITGEEKIKPERARFWVCTVEAMPRDVDVDFLAIDEVQLAGDPERGHVFTDRLLHSRGRSETLLLGAQTMREAIADLVPGANFISRPRLSKLTYAGAEEDHSPAAALRRRGVLRGRGLFDRRAHPTPARRRGSRARRTVAAHAQRAGRALPVGRCGLPGGHRCHRHGTQSRRGSCRVLGLAQVRRPQPPQPDAGRAEPDRGPRRPPHERRDVRRHRLGGAVRCRYGGAARDAQLRARARPAVAQPQPRLLLARSPEELAARDAATSSIWRAPARPTTWSRSRP